MRCEGAVALDVVDRDATGLVSLAAVAHVRTCAHCRRELAAQRRLRAHLHELAPRPVHGERISIADEMLATILAALDAEDRRSARRGLYALGAAAVCGGLVAAGAVVALTGRRRPLR